MVSHDRALGEWFDTCARENNAGNRTANRAGHGAGTGTWLRYAMRDGALA
jgi:macrolide transport system ATP-binding/permease protein